MKCFKMLSRNNIIVGLEPKPIAPTPRTALDPEKEKMSYRFRGSRYSMRGPSFSGPDDLIPQESGLFAFPNDGHKDEE